MENYPRGLRSEPKGEGSVGSVSTITSERLHSQKVTRGKESFTLGLEVLDRVLSPRLDISKVESDRNDLINIEKLHEEVMKTREDVREGKETLREIERH